MTSEQWEQIPLQDLPGYRITSLITSSGGHALFRATRAGTDAVEQFTIGCRDITGDSTAEDLVNRFREAAFLNHPNLAKIFDAGTFVYREHPLVYFVTEEFTRTLAHTEFPGLTDIEILQSVAPDIIEALSYLNSENFIYCSLCPHSVWWSGNGWKLADFSELRLAGRYNSVETRRLLIRKDISSPPEAYEGIVSTAWDAWSLGCSLHAILGRSSNADSGDPKRGRSGVVSSRCNELIQDLLEPDPDQRLTLSEFKIRLANLTLRPEAAQDASSINSSSGTHFIPTQGSIAEGSIAESSVTENKPGGWETHYTSSYNPLTILDSARRRRVPSLLAPVVLVFAALLVLAISTLEGGAQRKAASATHTGNGVVSTPGSHDELSSKGLDRQVRSGGATKEQSERAVSAVLRQWVNSTRARDLERQVDCYAPIIDRYYGLKHVSRDELRAEKEKVFESIGKVEAFSLRNLQFRWIGPGSLVVAGDKTWNFPERGFSGTVREEMTFREIGGAWKISGERELARPSATRGNAASPASLPSVTSNPETILGGLRD